MNLDGTQPQETLSTSDARIAANRRNAQRSTGPRSVEGKRRSSANATTHGGYAQSTAPITAGALAEDPEQVTALITGIITSLHPRDALELAHAQAIAQLYLRLERIARAETHALEADGRFTAEQKEVLGDEDVCQYELTLCVETEDELSFPASSDPQVSYRQMVEFIERHAKSDYTLLAARGP